MEQIRMPVLPDQIKRLDEAVVGGIDFRDCFLPKKGGGFVLTENAKRQIAEANEDLAKREAEANAALAARDAKIERLDATARDLAITSALFRCGVSAKHWNLAVPYLQKALQIEVDDSGAASVSGQSIEGAVASWLASENGSAFAPKQPNVPGPLASAVRRLRGQ